MFGALAFERDVLRRRPVRHVERDDDVGIRRDELDLLAPARVRILGLVLGRQLVAALPDARKRVLDVLEEDVFGRTSLHAAASVESVACPRTA